MEKRDSLLDISFLALEILRGALCASPMATQTKKIHGE